MGKNVEARLPRGFRDIFSDDCQLRRRMIDTIRQVYESYGFLPLETPAVEYVDVLGKFLPESDQPDAGIFGFKVEDQWLALRYDLTAPLSRIVAMYKELPQPFRRYQVGPVWRQEKPGPGRYREFYQFDIDIAGVESMAADAEICMVLADSIQALGFKLGEYVIKVSNRKILNGVIDRALENLADSQLADYAKSHKINTVNNDLKTNHRTDVMRCIDKLDRVGFDGVNELLQKGRKDPTGDFTPGCYLTSDQIAPIMAFLKLDCSSRQKFLAGVEPIVESAEGKSGVAELVEMDSVLTAAGYGDNQVIFDSQIVRGLAYYTGPVYEAVLTIPTIDEDGKPVQFGSIAGGGRYDSLIERFTDQKMPATGASIGVDRLLTAYAARQTAENAILAPVLVTVMDKPRLADYLAMAKELRQAGIAAELYLGQKGFRGQIKYADQKKMPVAVIAGEDEFNKGEVTLKDLRLGAQLAAGISDRDQWRKDQPAQIQVPRSKLVDGVKEILARYSPK
jgi:histidyl-tRNA synthetase